MTKRRRRRKKTSRINNTAPRRALQNPAVAARISELRKQWKCLDRIERGDRLRELIASGCSMRRLADELRCGLTTIRRHVDLANSPERAREAARNGYSAKRLLAHKGQVRKIQRPDLKLKEERAQGKFSDQAATLILHFCQPARNLFSCDVPLLLSRTRSILDWADVQGQRTPRAPKRLAPEVLFLKLRPIEEQDEFWLEHRARWLASVIASRFPERPIWENAIDKAARWVEQMEADAISIKLPVMGRK